MKVKELIEELKSVDPELEVILQKDAEGNGYSPLEYIDSEMVYVPDSTYSGEVHFSKLTKELEEEGYGPEDTYEGDDAVPCVILGPVN